MQGFERPTFRAFRMGQDSGIITSYDQGPAAQPVPGIVTQNPATTPSSSGPDWAKIISSGFDAAGKAYNTYTQAEIAQLKAQATTNPALMQQLMLQASLQQPKTDYTPMIVLGVAALAAVGLILALK